MSFQKFIGGGIILIISFILTYEFSQIISEVILNSEDYRFKNLLLFLIPSPKDNLLQLIQFLAYWGVAGFAFLKNK